MDINQLVDDLVPEETPEPKGPILSEFELSFVTFMHQMYALEGMMMTEAQAENLLKIKPKQFRRLITDPKVIAALEERGVTDRPVGVGEHETPEERLAFQALAPLQLAIANSMLDLVDTRSQKKKLQDLNISTQTYATWLKDPVFSNYMRKRAEQMLGENQHEAHLALLDKVRMGDIKALELFYEMQGMYTRVSASSANAASVAVDIQNLLVSIIEIINDEVDDPSTAARIADRFKGLMTARTIAGELLNTPTLPDGTVIHQPAIAPARVLTPELAHLMERGEGYE